MALFYHIGRILLCLAIALQGLYILGVIPGQTNRTLINSMTKGLINFQSIAHLPPPIMKEIERNVSTIAYIIGGLLATAIANTFTTSRFIIKLNIVGMLLLTFFIGIPYSVLKGQVDPLDPTDKSLFHCYANLALLGGLLYFHSAATPVKAKRD